MKAIVYGGTGFIGSHVAEQLFLAGHDVTVAVEQGEETRCLERLGVRLVSMNTSEPQVLANMVKGHDTVYHCVAESKMHMKFVQEIEEEITKTKRLVEQAAAHGASRFVYLSTTVIYDFLSNEPMDESYLPQPEYPIQALGLEWEKATLAAGRESGIETVVLRPASAIGPRDPMSFFTRLWSAHMKDQYPLVANGAASVSLIDARDIGRAMVWLGTYRKPELDNSVYLLKGFDTTWRQLKEEIDQATGRVAKSIDVPQQVTERQMKEYQLTPFTLKAVTVNRLWDDHKIRKLGFSTKYALADAVKAAVRDLNERSA